MMNMMNTQPRERMPAVFRDELAAVGVNQTEYDNASEVGITFVGVARSPAGFVARIQRRWGYFSVTLSPALPLAAALEVNHAPHHCSPGGDSGDGPALGAVARAHGYGMGLNDDALRAYQGGGRPVDLWHCDSIGALATLLRVLANVIAHEGLTAAAARAANMRRHTDEVLAHVEKHRVDGGHMFDLLVEHMHTSDEIDASDARVVAFRAAHPLKART